jgi:hypothetical protein
MIRIFSVLIFISLLSCLGCNRPQAHSNATPAATAVALPTQAASPAPSIPARAQEITKPLQVEPQSKLDEMQSPAHFFENQDRSESQGYVVRKLSRKALDEYPSESGVQARWVDVFYVAIEKDGKRLRKFDADIYFGLGNSADFGYFPFLGGDSQQLFISQDVPRGGCQWIVSLSPRFRTIFDGDEYGVGREGSDFGAIDLNKDGIYEITAPITSFYGFASLSPAATPLPTIVFKYDAKTERYLPANPEFQGYVLKDLDKQNELLRTAEDPMNHLSDIMSITLDYIFAGEERKAWTFFDESYKLADKKAIKAKIKAEIRNHPVYRFVYKRA